MPKASEIATELRRIADALDREPETDLVRPYMSFFCDQKEMFLTMARILPRPLKKVRKNEETRWPVVHLENDSPDVRLSAQIYQSKLCTLIKPAQPAVYDCEPLLSQEEEDALV